MKTIFLFVIIWLVFVTGSTLLAQKFHYVGAAECKKCHNKPATGQQYKIWSESAHANAMILLSSEKARIYANVHNIADPTKHLGCLKCHSTAGNLAESLQTGITIAEGVSCESCHGPGSAYITKTIMKDRELSIKNGLVLPTRYICEQCHNNYCPFNKPFDFDEMVKEIAHAIPVSPQK